MHDTRLTIQRHLPANYFADAQAHTLAAPENLGRAEQSGAESRETSGASGATNLSPAGQGSPHGTTGDSPELAKPAPADDAATGGRGLLSTAAHFARHAAGVGHRAYSVAAERIARAQQLHAAQIIFGKQS